MEDIESNMGTRMVTVLIPPRSTRPVCLLAGERGSGEIEHREYPRASQSPKATLQYFADSIPWRNGDDLVKEMPPANVLVGPRVLTPITLIAFEEYYEVVGNYHTMPVVQRSPTFGPPEQPMERVGVITSGRADVEDARPPPSRRERKALNARVGPETWAESQHRGSARYRISPMATMRWKTFGSDRQSSASASQAADGLFHRPTRSERENEMNRREEELLEDQECIWDIGSPCSSPRRLVRENKPGSCRYQRTSLDSKDEPRPTRRGAYNDHPLRKAILRHPGTSVHEGASLASTVSTLLADQDLPGGPSVDDLETATERCATPSVAITDDVILDPDALHLRSGRYPPGSLSTNRAPCHQMCPSPGFIFTGGGRG